MANILFINRQFYEYDEIIKNEFISRGHFVSSYSIDPSLSLSNKFFNLLTKDKIMSKYAKEQQSRMLAELKNSEIKYDVVFLLSGQTMRTDTMEQLRNMYPSAKFIWYMWDNINRLKEFHQISPFFDTLITFDPIEAKRESIEYLPLFYVYDIHREKKFDIGFIGTVHSNREKKVRQFIGNNKIEQVQIYFLAHNRLRWLKSYLDIRNASMKKYLHITPLTIEKTADLFSRCKAVLDYPFSSQTGLTMRTFEALGCHSKLITTNSNITQYDFFNEANIYVIKRPDEVIDPKFLMTPYQEVDENILKKYSITSWMDQMIAFFNKRENVRG